MVCPKCGKEVTGNRFCTACGHPVGDIQQQTMRNVTVQASPNKDAESKNGNTGMIILVCSLATALLIAVVVCCLLLFGASNDNEQEVLDTEPPASVEVPVAVEEEYVESFDRFSTYSSSYTYDTMGDIYSSYEVDDGKSNELADFIIDFNDAWIDYVNNGNTAIYRYVRTGTPTYDSVERFGKKNIMEEYILMDVNDVRVCGNYYFVWTHEIIKVTDFNDGSVKNKEYYWVYRVNESGGAYYVENFISDPAYK